MATGPYWRGNVVLPKHTKTYTSGPPTGALTWSFRREEEFPRHRSDSRDLRIAPSRSESRETRNGTQFTSMVMFKATCQDHKLARETNADIKRSSVKTWGCRPIHPGIMIQGLEGNRVDELYIPLDQKARSRQSSWFYGVSVQRIIVCQTP
jgi:hypothetical protein